MTTKLMVDSGAYSAFTQKTKIDMDKYIEFIKKNEECLEVYFNLDVLSNGGKSYVNWIHMRANGLHPVPVYHIGTDEKYLEKYLKIIRHDTQFLDKHQEGPDIAIGAIANMSTDERLKSLDRIWQDYLTDSDGMPVLKVHGFGLTSIRVMRNYCWWSVDSTSWVMFGRYGAILVPRTIKGEYVYNDNPFIVTVSSKSPKVKEAGKHFCRYPKNVRKHILKYIHHMGFEIGGEILSWEDGTPEVEVLEEGLSNVHYQRDMINMLYYLGVQESMPKWPWAFKTKERIPRL